MEWGVSMNDIRNVKMLETTMLFRLAGYAVVAGAAAALATVFAFPEWSQDGTGAKFAVIGALCGLIYAMLTRKRST
jgi:hypothetical protein